MGSSSSTAAFQKSLLDNDQSLASQSERINDACYIYICIVTRAGQSLERNSEDISILMGRGVEMARSESVQDSINTLQGYIDHYGQYRYERESSSFTLFVTPSFRSSHTEAPHGAKIFLFFLPLFLFFGFLLISLAIPLFRYRIGFTSTLVWPV